MIRKKLKKTKVKNGKLSTDRRSRETFSAISRVNKLPVVAELEYLNIERTQKFNAMKAICFPFFFSASSTSLFLLLEIRERIEREEEGGVAE